MSMNGVELTVFGHVHGVGFRYFIYSHATSLGLTGYVRNNPNGSVFIVAEGDENDIKQLIDFAMQGPARSAVHEKKIKYTTHSGIYSNFVIQK